MSGCQISKKLELWNTFLNRISYFFVKIRNLCIKFNFTVKSARKLKLRKGYWDFKNYIIFKHTTDRKVRKKSYI